MVRRRGGAPLSTNTSPNTHANKPTEILQNALPTSRATINQLRL